MKVIKRDSTEESVSFDKVLNRIQNLSNDLDHVNIYEVAQKVCTRIFNGVHTSELDELAAQMCSSMIIEHPDYGKLASRIIISNHQKNTSPSFSETVQILFDNKDVHGEPNPLVATDLYETVMKNKEKLNSYLDYERDFTFDYFGFKTLERGYLIKINGRVVERPQQMFMRVSLGIHGSDIREALQTYDLMSKKYFIHATPTLFHAGTRSPQNSSCYLLAMEDDSIDGIYNTLKECAMISKYAGGIGLHVHNVRARNSIIRGTNGQSTGIIPMLRVFNATSRYVNQCFTPETIIHTLYGPKPIKNICTQDMVLTINGTYKSVIEICTNHVNKEILEIDSDWCLSPIRCTKEHEIFVVTHFNKRKPICDLGKFVAANTLSVGDYMFHPIPCDFKECEVDSDFFRLYGIMLAIGRLDGNSMVLEMNRSTRFDTYLFVTNYLESHNIDYTVYEESISFYLNMMSVDMDYDSIVYGLKNVELCEELVNCDPYRSTMLIKGLIESCGEISDWIMLRLPNSAKPDLVHQIKRVLLNIGILAKSRIHINSFNKQSWSLSFPRDRYLCKYLEGVYPTRHLPYILRDDGIITRISSITNTRYSGYVYDLNICDNHNYTTDLGLVHNSGKRNGSIAMFMEPWHADVESFLELKKNHGNEEDRTRDLFLAMWIPDLFMERVKEDGTWSLMCPDQSPGLADVCGQDFNQLYTKYEHTGKFVKQVKAQELWFKMLESQIETGVPYMGFKDHVNRKTNQSNIGIIKSSNLCMEICEVSTPEETAVCNLASVCLQTYVDKENKVFNFEKMHDVVKVITKNLNKVIDVNFYPVEKARRSNMRHRPIGIGVQGLADTFVMLGMPFDSDQARELNKQIFETMYHAALEASHELAIKYGPYDTFKESPASKGILQFDMWGIDPGIQRYDWPVLKESIKKDGIRNSLLIAPMPTASTSQILGSNECFEPFTSNIYKRKTLAGEFILVNKYLVDDLEREELWTQDIRNQIVINDGSVQNITEIPLKIRELYKTVWEIKQKCIIDMAADRGPFICQSQSMNLFMECPDFKRLSSMHFYSWQKGLKTGIYYLRSKPKAKPQQFTIDPKLSSKYAQIEQDAPCETCSA